MRTITANDILLEFNSSQPIKAQLVSNDYGVSIVCVDRHDNQLNHGIVIPIDNESRVGVARELANVAGWPYKHMSKLSLPNPSDQGAGLPGSAALRR